MTTIWTTTCSAEPLFTSRHTWGDVYQDATCASPVNHLRPRDVLYADTLVFKHPTSYRFTINL